LSQGDFGFLLAAIFLVAAVAFYLLYQRGKRLQAQRDFIKNHAFPDGLFDKVRKQYPELEDRDLHLVARGLRQFFTAFHNSRFQFVSMPSQIADEMWHEMILYTREYSDFCGKAFGRFLHHTPAVAMDPDKKISSAGIQRVWYWVCKDENISPRNPSRLPLLFALDKKLNIKNGYVYELDCAGKKKEGESVHCGHDVAGSGCGGDSSGLDFGNSDSSGDSGCGGSGCGGGD